MKKIIFIAAIIIATISTSYSQGVVFYDGTYDEALVEAKKTGKDVILDFFTKGCAPCKLMERDVFPLAIMGDYINSRYIFVKCDAHKENNKELVKRFNPPVYPTYVFISNDDKELDRLIGSCRAEAYIARLKATKDKSLSIEALKTRYEAGERNKQFLKDYVTILSSQSRKMTAPVAEVLFQELTTAEMIAPENWYLIDDYISPGSFFETILIKQRKDFEHTIGKEVVADKLKQNCLKAYTSLYFAFDKAPTQKDISKVNAIAKQIGLDNDSEVIVYRATTEMAMNGKVEPFLAVFKQHQQSISDITNFVRGVTVVFSNKFTAEQRERFSQIITDDISKADVNKMLVAE